MYVDNFEEIYFAESLDFVLWKHITILALSFG